MEREIIMTRKAPAPVGAYSQATMAGGIVFVSGQIGLDENGALKEGFEAQAKQSVDNIAAILEAAGCGWADVLKLNVYVANMADFTALNSIFKEKIPAPHPARAVVQAAALPKGALVEIDATAKGPALTKNERL